MTATLEPRAAVRSALADYLRPLLVAKWPSLVVSDRWPLPAKPLVAQAVTVVTRGLPDIELSPATKIATYVVTIGAPVAAAVARGTTGATPYAYKVVAKDDGPNYSAASTAASVANGNATLSASNCNRVSWARVPGASRYDVYRTVGGATQGRIATNVEALQLDDTGLAASGAVPAGASANTATLYSYGRAWCEVNLDAWAQHSATRDRMANALRPMLHRPVSATLGGGTSLQTYATEPGLVLRLPDWFDVTASLRFGALPEIIEGNEESQTADFRARWTGQAELHLLSEEQVYLMQTIFLDLSTNGGTAQRLTLAP